MNAGKRSLMQFASISNEARASIIIRSRRAVSSEILSIATNCSRKNATIAPPGIVETGLITFMFCPPPVFVLMKYILINE